MGFSRSITASVITEKHFPKTVKQDTMPEYPIIPEEMINAFQSEFINFERTGQLNLSNSAKDLMVSMHAAWLLNSIIENNANSKKNKKNKMTTVIRSWGKRYLIPKSRTAITPIKEIEISENYMYTNNINDSDDESSYLDSIIEDGSSIMAINNPGDNNTSDILVNKQDTSHIAKDIFEDVMLKNIDDFINGDSSVPTIKQLSNDSNINDTRLTASTNNNKTNNEATNDTTQLIPSISNKVHDNFVKTTDDITQKNNHGQSLASTDNEIFYGVPLNNTNSTECSDKDLCTKDQDKTLSTDQVKPPVQTKELISIPSLSNNETDASIQEDVITPVTLSPEIVSSSNDEKDFCNVNCNTVAKINSVKGGSKIGRSITTIFSQFKKAFKKKPKFLTNIEINSSINQDMENEDLETPSLESDDKSISTLFTENQDVEDVPQYCMHLYKQNSNENNSLKTVFSDDENPTNSNDLYGDTSKQFAQICDDLQRQSEIFQERFAVEDSDYEDDEDDEDDSIWSSNMKDYKRQVGVRASKTESNMYKQPIIPYVSIGQPNQDTNSAGKSSVKSIKNHIDLKDAAMYKKSISLMANLDNFDLKWQQVFREENNEEDHRKERLVSTLKCISYAFCGIINRNHQMYDFDCDSIFDESRHDRNNYDPPESEPLTHWTDIYNQLAYVFSCGELTIELAVITYIYVKRMTEGAKQSLWDYSWRFILFTGIITAVKSFDDCAIFNSDFASIFPQVNLRTINEMERIFLINLEYDITVKCQEFAGAYFHLLEIERIMVNL